MGAGESKSDESNPSEPCGSGENERPKASSGTVTAAVAARALSKIQVSEKLSEPWRKFERGGNWSNGYRMKLISEIESFKNHEAVKYVRILLTGPIAAGKSSFINSMASIDKGRIANVAITGGEGKSLSTKLKVFRPKGAIKGQFQFLDTMGIEEQEGEGFNLQDAVYLIKGNVKPDYQFKPNQPINEDEDKFIQEPSLKDQPHCIAIFMDSSVIDTDSVSKASKAKLKEFKTYIRQNEVPIVIVLTKIDKFFKEEKIDVKSIYESPRIKEIVEKASELFGVPEMNIFPVQNYSKESNIEQNMDILLLLAIRRMIHIAYDRLECMADQEETSSSDSDVDDKDKSSAKCGKDESSEK